MLDGNLDGNKTPEKKNEKLLLDELKDEIYCFEDMKVAETLGEFESLQSLQTGKYYFFFKEGVVKQYESLLPIDAKYIEINGRKYNEVSYRDKTTGRGYHIGVDGKRKVGSLYLGNFKNGIQNGNGVVVYSNGNRYEGEYKDGYPVKGRAKFHGEMYSVEYESGKGLKITSDGEYKGKHINLTESKLLD